MLAGSDESFVLELTFTTGHTPGSLVGFTGGTITGDEVIQPDTGLAAYEIFNGSTLLRLCLRVCRTRVVTDVARRRSGLGLRLSDCANRCVRVQEFVLIPSFSEMSSCKLGK